MTSSCNAKVTLEHSGWVLHCLIFTQSCMLGFIFDDKLCICPDVWAA